MRSWGSASDPPVSPPERIYDDASFECAAAALLFDPVLDSAGRGLHANQWTDLSRRQLFAAQSRPLQHDPRRDQTCGIQSAVARNAAAGRGSEVSASLRDLGQVQCRNAYGRRTLSP